MSAASLLLSVVPEPGGYVDPADLLTWFGVSLPWLYGLAWADKDTRELNMGPAWTPILLAAGLVGLAVWLLAPVYSLGLGVYLVLTSAAGAVYVLQRNMRVAPEVRVLTPGHIRLLLQGKRAGEVELQTRLKVYDHAGRPVLPPQEEAENDEKRTYNLVQGLLYDVVWRRASQAVLGSSANPGALRYVIDGVPLRPDPLERSDAGAIISYVKRIGGMDVGDRRRPQRGKIVVDLANQPIDMDVITAGSTSGEKMQLKIVQESVRTHLDQLGMEEDILRRVQQINALPRGLVIVAARPGNGMTSTLYSLLRENDAYIKQLASVEAKPEVDMENITQRRYTGDSQIGPTLQALLRRDPDVIMVDRCPDARTAGMVLAGAAEKKILLGMDAQDTFSALAWWVKLAGDAGRAVEPLHAVLCQVLLRTLCPACREAYKPKAELLRKANMPVDKDVNFYRPPIEPPTDEKGRPITCPTCQGSGYLGRTAAFELLELSDPLRKLVADGASLTQIKAAARKQKMLYLQERALGLVVQGRTSVQEVIRVSQDDKKKSKQEQEG